MSNVVELVSFKLKEGSSVADFLVASDKFNEDFVSKQKGYISRKLLNYGEVWSDLVIWETMEYAQNAAKAIHESPAAGVYLPFLDANSIEMHHHSVEKSY